LKARLNGFRSCRIGWEIRKPAGLKSRELSTNPLKYTLGGGSPGSRHKPWQAWISTSRLCWQSDFIIGQPHRQDQPANVGLAMGSSFHHLKDSRIGRSWETMIAMRIQPLTNFGAAQG